MRAAPRTLPLAITGILLAAPQARAANADFQNFFFGVCAGTPTGVLAARCAETPGATGNVSGDSESSLNPSQNLAHNQPAISTAQTRSKEARERGEKLRDEGPGEEGVQVAAGPWSLLVNVHGTWFDRGAGALPDVVRGFEGDSRALEIGFDRRMSDRLVLGGIAGFERMDYDFDAEAPGTNFTPAAVAGTAENDNTYLTLFASWSVGEAGFAELSGGFETIDGSYRRNSVFQESTRTIAQTNVQAEGDADNEVTWLSFNAGFDHASGAWNLGPYAGLTWTRSKMDAYTERDLSGSGLNMSFSGTSRESLLGHAGLRASYVASTRSGVVVPQLRVEFQHEFDNQSQRVAASYALDSAGTQYLFASSGGDRDSVNAGLSIAFVLKNGWMPFFDYSILLGNDDLDRQRATLGLRVEF
jgi:outer membrane autotransporter protein